MQLVRDEADVGTSMFDEEDENTKTNYATSLVSAFEQRGIFRPLESMESNMISPRAIASMAEPEAHFDNQCVASLTGCLYMPVQDQLYDGVFVMPDSLTVLLRVQVKHSGSKTYTTAKDAGTVGGRRKYSKHDCDVFQFRELAPRGRSTYVEFSSLSTGDFIEQQSTIVDQDANVYSFKRKKLKGMSTADLVSLVRKRVLMQEMSEWFDYTVSFQRFLP